MDRAPAFAIGLAGYAVHRLRPEDAGALQALFERCRDYCLLVDGRPASPMAGQETFQEVPPGRAPEDKLIFGVVDEAGLAGLLEAVPDYPEAGVWWIGLLLLAPEVRGRGVGREVVEGFAAHARTQGATAIMLGVVEENVRAYRFWQQLGFWELRRTEPRHFGRKTQRVYVLQRATCEEEPMQEAILELEKGAMERWRQGDPMGWAELSTDGVTYVDPGLVQPIVGLEAYRAYLHEIEGQVHYEGSEFIEPKVVAVGDDAAVLTYNYRSLPDLAQPARGGILWNATEVYFREGGQWRIAHTHWSFVRHKLPTRVEVPVPVETPPGEYEGVLGELMALESEAMARWRQGDPWGFTDISAPGVTYFDTGTPARLNGLEALKAEYAQREGQIHYDVMEFIEPRVQVWGEAAVLLYRFFSTVLEPDGSVASRTPWNCSEVYARLGGQWRIVHTHWSLIRGERM